MFNLPRAWWRRLRDNSRSFFLTVRVLPGSIRPQIGLAYLLARASDTIADTSLVAPGQRLAALDQFARAIQNPSEPPPAWDDLARRQGRPAERDLLEHTAELIGLIRELDPADASDVRAVLATIASGQQLDLMRFASASAQRLVALESPADLDDYTYRVAGCVGEFWTRLCRRHAFPSAPLEEDAFRARGVRFGRGLQLVNVLRDLPRDLRQGRCYLPRLELEAAGLHPEELLDPAAMDRLRPVYRRWIDQADGHLRAGWAYTLEVPRRCPRIRLACAWPILIGRATLDRLGAGNVLDADQRIKTSRRDVRRLIARTLMLYPFDRAWSRLAPAE